MEATERDEICCEFSLSETSMSQHGPRTRKKIEFSSRQKSTLNRQLRLMGPPQDHFDSMKRVIR